ncbi:flagellar export chaperone FliS [Rubrivivax sp. RP6-9]|uniref:flagellar export chaperone FliS n=1 Tax=Rubrivivax sp. RP6-9 TaxID=3415750 RepID=UPI003CC6056F
MFSTATASRSSNPFANVYRQIGTETGVSGASPHKLVAMLFDGYMDAVARARGAMRAGDVQAKGRAIGHAVRIVEEGLRASLDMQAGGNLARDLNDLYGYLTMRLTLANVRNDEAGLDEAQALMQPLREAWMSIADKAEAATGGAARR